MYFSYRYTASMWPCLLVGVLPSSIARFLCRFFLEPKWQVVGTGRVAPHVTWMKACCMMDRALLLMKARYAAFVHARERSRKRTPGEHADPNAGSNRRPRLEGTGQHYTKLVSDRCDRGTSERKVPVQDVVSGCMYLLNSRAEDACAWFLDVVAGVQGNSEQVFLHCKAVVFHRARLQHCLVSSALTLDAVTREGKSNASAYCLVSVPTGEAGHPRAVVPAYIRYFLLVQWQDTNNSTDRLARVNIIDVLPQDADVDAAFCSRVHRFDPGPGVRRERDRWVHVSDIVRPLILIKAKPPNCVWRLVQFQGRLLGSFDGTVDEDE